MLKLKKANKISENMKKAMTLGYYPEEQIVLTVSKATKAGKELWNKFQAEKTYKTNIRIKFETTNGEYFYDENRKELVSSEIIYVEKENLKNQIKKIVKFNNFVKFMEIKEVKEYHHICDGSKNLLINVKDLINKGFQIDFSTANKEFAI